MRKKKKGDAFASQSKPFIQPKLSVGKVGDKYEVEADAMADQVVNKTQQGEGTVQRKGETEEEVQQKPLANAITPLKSDSLSKKEERPVRRMEAEEETPVQSMEEEETTQMQEEEETAQMQEEEESMQMQEEEEAVQAMEEEETAQMQEEEETAQMQEEEESMQKQEEEEAAQMKEEEEAAVQTKGGGPASTTAIEHQLKRNKGKGSPLSGDAKTEMEQGFGADFSDVKIHTDSEAAEMADALGAQAFTHGNDVYFNEGKYDPQQKEGKHLLAHELTHTIQQQGAKEMINKYPHQGCEDGEVIDQAQTVVWFEHDSTRFRTDGEVDSTIHFQLLLSEIRNYLDMVGSDGIVFIHGYASEEGGTSHNLTLSMQRAIRIKTLLVANGVPASQMIPIAHGESSAYEQGAYNRRVEVTYHPRATCMVFDPLPVTGSLTAMDCSDGRDINSDADHDLDKLTHRPDDRSPDIWIYDNLLGESGAYSDFYIGFFTGTLGVDTSDDNRLFNNFTTGSGNQINFSTGSDMAREIGGTDAFTTFANAFEESVRNYFNIHHTLNGFDCQAELIRTRPNYIGGSDSLFSWAVMGGYQRLEAHIDLSSGQIDITYRVFDHYGAGVSDAWSYLPGLSAMYYLQHYVTGSSRTYVPFIWSVRVNRTSAL